MSYVPRVTNNKLNSLMALNRTYAPSVTGYAVQQTMICRTHLFNIWRGLAQYLFKLRVFTLNNDKFDQRWSRVFTYASISKIFDLNNRFQYIVSTNINFIFFTLYFDRVLNKVPGDKKGFVFYGRFRTKYREYIFFSDLFICHFVF